VTFLVAVGIVGTAENFNTVSTPSTTISTLSPSSNSTSSEPANTTTISPEAARALSTKEQSGKFDGADSWRRPLNDGSDRPKRSTGFILF